MPLRLRHFRPRADAYLAASRGPLHYMLRLHAIEQRTEAFEEDLRERWRGLAAECDGDPRASPNAGRPRPGVDFAEVNDLVERHNRWYPAESRLPMDPVRATTRS